MTSLALNPSVAKNGTSKRAVVKSGATARHPWQVRAGKDTKKPEPLARFGLLFSWRPHVDDFVTALREMVAA
jgi:hypothetical protein